jgi:GTPase SAR1 family protein
MKEIRDLQFLFDCVEDGDGIMNEFKNTVDDSYNLFSTVLGFIKPTEIKVALIGLQSVGKTCFLERLKTGKFNRFYRGTSGYDIHEYQHDYMRKFVFYDFSAVERYAYSDYYYKPVDFDIIALMIDYNRLSYLEGKKWLNKLLKIHPKSVGVIIKNKIDLDKDGNANVRKAGKISVKNNEGIDTLLEKMAMYGS